MYNKEIKKIIEGFMAGVPIAAVAFYVEYPEPEVLKYSDQTFSELLANPEIHFFSAN